MTNKQRTTAEFLKNPHKDGGKAVGKHDTLLVFHCHFIFCVLGCVAPTALTWTEL